MRNRTDIVLLLLAIILTVCGFLLFRLLIAGKTTDYAKEIASAIFGVLLTITITAIMLQKQSAVDMRKDRNAKMLEAKLKMYDDLIGGLGNILAADDVTDYIVPVQVLNQRLALLGDQDVVESFSKFASRFARAARAAKDRSSGKLTDREKDELLEALGEMSVDMRVDVLSGEELQEFESQRDKFRAIVTSNVNSLKTKAITQQGFIEACSDEERPYFLGLVNFLEEEGLKFDMRTKGLSVKSGEGKSVLWAFPSETKRGLELLRENLPEAVAGDVLAILTANGIGEDRLEKKRVGFKPAEIPLDETKKLLQLVKQGVDAATE